MPPFTDACASSSTNSDTPADFFTRSGGLRHERVLSLKKGADGVFLPWPQVLKSKVFSRHVENLSCFLSLRIASVWLRGALGSFVRILSPDDRLSDIRVKAREYLRFGTRHVWTVDPISGECYEHRESHMSPVQDGVLRVQKLMR